MQFDQIIDTNNILKTVRGLVQICLSKIKVVAKTIEEKDELDRTISEKDASFIKLTEQNNCLKIQIKA